MSIPFDVDNNMIVGMAFENFVISVLREYLIPQNKTIEVQKNDIGFDAYLPNGIDEIDTPVFVEIKRFLSNKSSYFSSIRKWKIIDRCTDAQFVLLIIGDTFSSASKDNIRKLAEATTRIPVIVWDINDFNNKTQKYQALYVEYVNNPNKALVENAINDNTSIAERIIARQQLLERVRKCYSNEDVVLFLGAGVSIDAGIPLWSELVYRLLASMIINKLKSKESLLSTNQINKLIELADNNREESPLAQVRYIRTAFSLDEYNDIVHDALYKDRPNIKTELLTAICDMCAPKRNHIGVRAVVTYNFDDLLERALNSVKVANNTICCDADIGSNSKLDIFHVHGFLPKTNRKYFDEAKESVSLVFSEEDYHRIYRDAYNWSNIVQLNFIRENTCLFIGCSINDPNLRRLLDVAGRNKEHPRHFAFMKRTTYKADPILDREAIETYKLIDESIRDKYFASLGLNIIWVDDYSEIPRLLKEIVDNDKLMQ